MMNKSSLLSLLIFLIGVANLHRTYAQVPVISNISQASGAVGITLTINGSNFNTTPYMNIVSFGAGRAYVSSATTTSLVVQVPYCTTYEPISVLNYATHLTGYSKVPYRRTLVYGQRNSISAGDLDPKVDIATGEKPNKILLSDLDGDGKSDIVVANATGNSVSIFRNQATYGSLTSAMFASETTLSTNGNPKSMAITDVNGDGAPDIVVVNSANNSVSIFRNTSTGAGNIQFAPKVDMETGNNPYAVSVGDMDLDGWPDIAVANLKDNTVSIFRNTSTAFNMTFASRLDLVTGANPDALSLGDLDNDGKMEIAVVNLKDNNFSVFKNTSVSGTLSFNPRVDFATGSQPAYINIADVNLDGKLDVMVANYGPSDHNISVYRNTSASAVINAGTFAARVNYDVGQEPTCVTIGDIDGEGLPDILATNFNSKTVSVLRNISATTNVSFSSKVDLATGFAPETVYVGDVDGDGAVDIMTTNSFQNNLSVMRYYIPYSGHPALAESTAAASVGSFVNVDLSDDEWKQEAPITSIGTPYTIAADNAGMINSALDAPVNAGRFAYFFAMGSRTPVWASVDGNLTFTATGSGSIEVRLISSYDGSTQVSHVFALTGDGQPHDYNWDFLGLYPQLEYYVGVIFNNGSVQGKAQFKKNFSLVLRQAGLAGDFIRFRADKNSLIGNSETIWSGYNDSFHQVRKKYLQHSAYARMKFQTDATHMVIEYVRDIGDKRIVNLYPILQNVMMKDFDANGNIISGFNGINTATLVQPGKVYTISGLHTTNPQIVWFNGSTPISTPSSLGTNLGTVQDPVFKVTAPANATNMGLLVFRLTNTTNFNDPVNDNFDSFAYGMVVQGSPGDVTPDGILPLTNFQSYSGPVPSLISGITVYVNGSLYKYYQLDGNDLYKQVQYLVDDLPPGMKSVEVVMPGQGALTDFSPLDKRSGNFLRAVYFSQGNSTVLPASTKAPNSIVYLHDSILSGYNISSNAQNNVWMMKIARDPNYGFTGDVFSEGYAGRILHTDTGLPNGPNNLAAKLTSFGVNNFWFQIGVNDFSYNVPLYQFYTEYKQLIEQIHTLNSNAHIFIQSIGPEVFQGQNNEIIADDKVSPAGRFGNDFKDVQRALATSHAYCEYVDFENLFPANDLTLPDGIHPSDAGNLAYANGIRDKSTLLGNTPAPEAFDFNRIGTPILTFDKNIPGVSVIRVKGGKPPYTYILTSGSLPTGVNLEGGVLVGTPTVAGTFPINVIVRDANNESVISSFSVIVNDPTIQVAKVRIPAAQTGVFYKTSFMGVFGAGPYAINMSSGSLGTSGLTFDTNTGALSGTPVAGAAGTTLNFTITATDHFGRSGSRSYTLPIASTAPATVTDPVFFDYHVTSSGDAYLRARVTDFYSGSIIAVGGLSVYQGQNGVFLSSSTEQMVIDPYRLVSNMIYIGHVNLSAGAPSYTVHGGAIFPTTIDGVQFEMVSGSAF